MRIETAILFLRDFELTMDIGVHEFELHKPQRVLVDVEMEVSGDLAFADDNLGSVVDYDFLRTTIRAIAAGRRFNTQEAFCSEILRRVLDRPEVIRAAVTTRKPDVYEDAAAVGCRMMGARGT